MIQALKFRPLLGIPTMDATIIQRQLYRVRKLRSRMTTKNAQRHLCLPPSGSFLPIIQDIASLNTLFLVLICPSQDENSKRYPQKYPTELATPQLNSNEKHRKIVYSVFMENMEVSKLKPLSNIAWSIKSFHGTY